MKKVLELLNTGVTNLTNGDTEIWINMKSILLCLEIDLKFEVDNLVNPQTQQVRKSNNVMAEVDLSQEGSAERNIFPVNYLADTLKSYSKASTNAANPITIKDTAVNAIPAQTTEVIDQDCDELTPESLSKSAAGSSSDEADDIPLRIHYPCQLCHRVFRFLTSLERHEKKHKNSDQDNSKETDKSTENDPKTSDKSTGDNSINLEDTSLIQDVIEIEETLAVTKSPTPDPNMAYPYKCRHCGSGFFLLDALEQHLLKHFSDKVTQQSTSALKNLGQEQQTIPQDVPTQTSKAMTKKKKGPKRYKCHKCHLRYTSMNAIKFHAGSVHYRDEVEKYFAPDKKFQCRICKKRFKTNASITSHIVIAHRALDELFPSKVKIETELTIEEAKTKVIDQNVNKIRMDLEKTVVQDPINTTFSNQNRVSRIVPKDPAQIIQRAENKDWIQKKEIFYDCDICKQKFGSHSLRIKHLAEVHFPGVERKQYCQTCNRKFCSESKLYFHLATEHKSLAKIEAPVEISKKLKKY